MEVILSSSSLMEEDPTSTNPLMSLCFWLINKEALNLIKCQVRGRMQSVWEVTKLCSAQKAALKEYVAALREDRLPHTTEAQEGPEWCKVKDGGRRI